jgi:hypothetical protein
LNITGLLWGKKSHNYHFNLWYNQVIVSEYYWVCIFIRCSNIWKLNWKT